MRYFSLALALLFLASSAQPAAAWEDPPPSGAAGSVHGFLYAPDLGDLQTLARPGAVQWLAHLPLDARQGPVDWWVGRLVITIKRTAGVLPRGDREMLLTLRTNGSDAVRVRMRVTAATIRAAAGGLVAADASGSDSVTLTAENYLQVSGVKPGANVVAVELSEETPGDEPRSPIQVTLEAGTGIGTTRASPNETGIVSVSGEVKAAPGETVQIPYRLSRRGSRPAKAVRIGAASNSPLLEVVSGAAVVNPPWQDERGTITVRAEAVGAFQLRIGADGGYNRPAALVRVRIVEPDAAPADGGSRPSPADALLALVGAATAATLVRRLRRRHRLDMRRRVTA